MRDWASAGLMTTRLSGRFLYFQSGACATRAFRAAADTRSSACTFQSPLLHRTYQRPNPQTPSNGPARSFDEARQSRHRPKPGPMPPPEPIVFRNPFGPEAFPEDRKPRNERPCRCSEFPAPALATGWRRRKSTRRLAGAKPRHVEQGLMISARVRNHWGNGVVATSKQAEPSVACRLGLPSKFRLFRALPALTGLT